MKITKEFINDLVGKYDFPRSFSSSAEIADWIALALSIEAERSAIVQAEHAAEKAYREVRADIASKRSAMQAKCPHPKSLVTNHSDPAGGSSYRECGLCGAEL